jgi:hypothetical protein
MAALAAWAVAAVAAWRCGATAGMPPGLVGIGAADSEASGLGVGPSSPAGGA